MCGIAGIVADDATSYINSMTNAISHRGPDDSGSYFHNNLALGHRRLSIQDLSANGHQPMISTDGMYIIVFNGEIYNHWEIRNKYLTKYKFISTSDTETLLYGFIELGKDILNKINGIFSFAIYNKKEKELFIARDQFGVKPLYYYQDKNVFLFSSEIKTFMEYPEFDRSIDTNALANYLYFLWSPGESTPFSFSKKLLSGHYITINTNNLDSFSIHKYYEIPFNGVYGYKTEEQWINELDDRLTKAVERQLLSDVPVGFFLSGGLDSSLIVSLAKKLNPEKKLKCFTIDTESNSKMEGFEEDLPYAKRVAELLNVDLEVVKADVDIVNDFDMMIYHLDEPQSDSAPLNVSNICKSAREQGYVVLLGGTGGDDLFTGYRRHQTLFYDDKIKFIPFFIKKLIQKTLVGLSNNSALKRRLLKFFSLYKHRNPKEQSASLYGWLPAEKVKKLFKDNLASFAPNEFLISSLKSIKNENSRLNQMLFWDLKYFLTDHNLNYTDKMSMAHGVEIRVPYLDKELVEFSATLPPELKLKGTTTKYILRKVAERYLPKEVVYRSKSGFGAPVRDWILNDMDDKINSVLNKEEINKYGIFDYNAIRDLIVENKMNKIDASYSIWALLAIDSWLNQFAIRN